MFRRVWLVGSVLILLLAVSFTTPAAIVRGQYTNGPLIWIDFQVLNKTGTMQLSSLGGVLIEESLALTIYKTNPHNATGSLSMSGDGIYQIDKLASTGANIRTGHDNRTVNSIDYALTSVSPDGYTTTSQTIHVFNVPGAADFLLTVTYIFATQGD